jgi:hypothetical protein
VRRPNHVRRHGVRGKLLVPCHRLLDDDERRQCDPRGAAEERLESRVEFAIASGCLLEWHHVSQPFCQLLDEVWQLSRIVDLLDRGILHTRRE